MPSKRACSISFPAIVLLILTVNFSLTSFALAEDKNSFTPESLIKKMDKQSQQIDLLRKQHQLQKNELQVVKKQIETKTKEIEDIRFQQNLISKNKSDQKLVVRLNNKYHLGFGSFSSKEESGRYFVSEIIIINLTSKPVTITKDMITLLVDGKPYTLKEIPLALKSQTFSLNNQLIKFSNIRQMKSHTILPGGSVTDWMTFTHLRPGTHIPKLHLKIEPKDHSIDIDINDYARKQMFLTIEELGPKNTLALLNISGIVNTINIGHLVDVLDQLATKQITRVVINWSDSAQPLDGVILSWFRQIVQATRSNYLLNALPMIPVSIRELHLSHFPNTISNSSQSKKVLHKDAYEAVQAALESAFEVLPRDILLEEIKNGHVLTKAAAIASGGGRLPPEDLPLILKLADDDDVHIQKSALVALSHFGDEAALKKLIEYVKKNIDPLSEIATESLALSRYRLAQDFLLDLLKNEPPESQKKIVKILAKHPRLAWNEVIYQYAIDPNGEIVLESLKALVQIGHPKLLEALKNSLQHPSREISELAFRLLATRYDTESENIALDHALKRIKTKPLDDQIIALFNRTKDQRAIPILLNKLDQSTTNRKYKVISTLADIGDQSVAEELSKRYQKMGPREKKTILNALLKLNSDKFYELAKKELRSNDTGIIQVICQGLQRDGSPESIQLLISGFELASNKSAMSIFARALSNIATTEVRLALYKNEYLGVGHKKSLAIAALHTINSKSPGFKIYLKGIGTAKGLVSSQKNEWIKAIEYFTEAINSDPHLLSAFVERGRAYLNINKNEEAHSDFERARELNPYNSFAVTGIGTAYVAEGKIEQAIKTVEDSRSRFPKEALFTYNSACVYSLACEYLKKQTDLNQELISQYEKQAIIDLKLSIEYGFYSLEGVEPDWIKKDPDLNTLRKLEEFKKIINNDVKPRPSTKPKGSSTKPKGPSTKPKG